VSLRGSSAKEITRDALLQKVSEERQLRSHLRRAAAAALTVQVPSLAVPCHAPTYPIATSSRAPNLPEIRLLLVTNELLSQLILLVLVDLGRRSPKQLIWRISGR
jgi:hypothetical protein